MKAVTVINVHSKMHHEHRHKLDEQADHAQNKSLHQVTLLGARIGEVSGSTQYSRDDKRASVRS